MKKIMLCSLMALVAWGIVVDGCWAAEVITNPNYAGNGTWVFAPNKAVRCGTRDGHVQNEHYVTKFGGYNNNQEHEFQTRQCLAHGNDRFITADTPKCGSGTRWCIDVSKAYEVCSPNNDIAAVSPYYHVFESAGHMCWDCNEGYSTPAKDYTIPSEQCSGSVCKITTRMCVPDDMVNCFKAAAAGQAANWNGTSCNCGSVNGINYTWKNGNCVAGGSSDSCKDTNGETVAAGDESELDTCTKALIEEGGRTCTCVCMAKEWRCDIDTCANGSNPDKMQRNATGGLGVCKKKGGGNGGGSSCKQSRSTEEGKACCDFNKSVADWNGKNCVCADQNKEFKKGDNGKWGCLPKVQESCETKFAGNQNRINCCNAENRGEAAWVDALNRCECQNSEQDWDVKTGKCVNRGNVVVGGDDKAECFYNLNVDIQCKNGNHFSKNASVKLTNEQVTAAQCDTLKQNMTSMENLLTTTRKEVNTYAEIIKSVCGDNSTSILPYSEADLKAARATLQSFFANAAENASVWKTEAGNFNSARLASDLTAGVVLGTVGGVVSSKVIKKKQIEKGFEVLHCTIGGQTAADWGDTFTVGLN